jgi:hypothetical protein
VNGCKTPGCNNFGVTPREGPIKVGRGASTDSYILTKSGSTTITCKKCGVSTKLKSNKAIFEELERQGDQIWTETTFKCPNDDCTNPNPTNATLKKHGTSKSGSQRFQCLACKQTFSIGKSTLRQRQPHKNAQVFLCSSINRQAAYCVVPGPPKCGIPPLADPRFGGCAGTPMARGRSLTEFQKEFADEASCACHFA